MTLKEKENQSVTEAVAEFDAAYEREQVAEKALAIAKAAFEEAEAETDAAYLEAIKAIENKQ